MLRSSSANGAAADLTKGAVLSAKLRSFFSLDIVRPKKVPSVLVGVSTSPKSVTPLRRDGSHKTSRPSIDRNPLPSTEQSMVPIGGMPPIKGATGVRKVSARTPPQSMNRGNSNLVSIGGVGKGGGPLSQSSPLTSPTSNKQQTMAAAGRPTGGGRSSMAQGSLAALMGGMSLSSYDQRDSRSNAPTMTKGNKPEYPAGSSTTSWSSTTLASLSPYSVSKSQLPPAGQQQSQSPSQQQLPMTLQSTTGATAAPATKGLCCDKCDGKHETDNCPHYKKARDDHIDAKKNGWKLVGGTSSLPGAILRSARVIAQPGDGNCLFHSMSYGIKDGSNANLLRKEICEYILANPATPICETPLSDWVKWDSNSSCAEYARKMSRGSWGGGIEMACMSRLKGCNVHVYERDARTGGFKRISAFDHPIKPEQRKIVMVLYRGGVHYDALVE